MTPPRMLRAVLFDLFETLVTESVTRPAGVSSLAPEFGCEREAFRKQWKPLRSAVTVGQLSFRQALRNVATTLGGHAEEATLEWLSEERTRTKAEAFAHIDDQVLSMVDYLRGRNLRLGIVSNCFAEDVAAWPHCYLSSRFDCTVFSCEAGLAKPDPRIYIEAIRRLGVEVSEPGSSATEEATSFRARSTQVSVRSRHCGSFDAGLIFEKSRIPPRASQRSKRPSP